VEWGRGEIEGVPATQGRVPEEVKQASAGGEQLATEEEGEGGEEQAGVRSQQGGKAIRQKRCCAERGRRGSVGGKPGGTEHTFDLGEASRQRSDSEEKHREVQRTRHWRER
jgi:hypothetical protein